MRDVISNETIKEINEVIDEILTNIDDNVRNIQNGEGNSALPTLFSFTNYSGQIHKVHGSIFRNHIIIDNADGNSYSAVFRTEDGDIFTTIGDKNGKQIATVDEKVEGYSNLAYFRESYKSVGTDQYGTEYDEIPAIPFDITHNYYTDITGFSFDILEQSNSASITDRNCRVMSFKLANIPVGSTFTVTFRGRFSGTFLEDKTPYIAINDRFDDTDEPVPLGGAYVDIIKDEQVHNYSITFTNSTQFTDLYLHFYFDVDSFTSFDVDSLLVSEMDIGIIRCEVYHSGKWYMIATGGGGGTSDLDAIELTYAEYQALTPAEKTDPDKIYFITDYPASVGALNDLSDVDITTPTEGQILTYDDTDDEWKNTDVDDVTPTVTEASARANLSSGDSLKIIIGKIKKWFSDLGTAAFKNVPSSGNAATTEVVMGNDTRLTDSRNAADVYSWAKASTKPSYTASEVGLGNVPNVATNDQTPTFTQASSRANIASGEKLSVIFGKIMKWFADLKDLAFIAKDGTSSTKYLRGDGTWQTFPTIPTVNNATLTIQKNGTTVETFTANASSNKTANITVPTKTSELTNDSGYTTNTGTVTQVKVGSTAYNPSSGVVSLPAYPTSLPASDVSAWAKANAKPSYAFNEINAGIASIGDGANGIKWRTNSAWTSGVYYQTSGDESVVFCNLNTRTSWMFAYADFDTRPAWTGLTPSLHIKNGKVAINKLIANSANLTYPLEVNGDVQATNFRGNLVGNANTATKATKDGDGNTISSTYLKKSGGTMTGTLTSRSIEPSSDALYSLGSSSKGFNIGWLRALYSNTVTCGRTGVGGKSTQGILEFYPYNHANDNRVQFMVDSDATLTTIYTVNIRAKSGTLALTSDIPSAPHTVREYTGTITGDVVRVTHNLGLGTSYKPIVSWTCSSAILMYGMKNITTNYFEVMFMRADSYVLGTATGLSVTIRWTY